MRLWRPAFSTTMNTAFARPKSTFSSAACRCGCRKFVAASLQLAEHGPTKTAGCNFPPQSRSNCMSAPEAVKSAPPAAGPNGDVVKIPDDLGIPDVKSAAEVKKEPE